nr:immunoglobulin heavy chain junction region [Macaca mulatta]
SVRLSQVYGLDSW